jgi:hypothetical protein
LCLTLASAILFIKQGVKVSESDREVRETWLNQNRKDEETPIDWLKDGAELERERLLGYRKQDNER